MSNKKVIRETFDREFGANIVHSEIVSKIKRKENHQIMKSILTLTSIVLISALLVILLLGNNSISQKYDETKIYDVIKINKLNLDDVKISLNDVDGRMDDKNSENILLKYPFINQLKIPKDMLQNVKISEFYASNNKASYLYNELIGYYISYLKEDDTNQQNNRLVNIFFSKTNKKMARCFPINEENLEKSSINNNEIIIINENYGYIVLFKYNDIYFDIEVENINIDELLDIVKSIML